MARYYRNNELKNNISYGESRGVIDEAVQTKNTWNLSIANPKFMSLDPSSPFFLKPSESGPVIDKGVSVGLSYGGAAPDLGAIKEGQRIADLQPSSSSVAAATSAPTLEAANR